MKVTDKTIDQKTIRKIQVSQYYMLESFKDFCDKHELKFVLDFGSMIGALRHQGFIPWDDDVDVGMLRDDYEKFLILSKDWEYDKIFVQNYHTDPQFAHSFTRLRLNDTLAIQETWKTLNVHHGIFLDVFPFDMLPEDEAEVENHTRQIQDIQNEKMKLVEGLEVDDFNVKALNIKQTELVTKYNDDFTQNKWVAHMTQGLDLYSDLKRLSDDFRQTILIKFEDRKFPIPSDYDLILRRVYGDYKLYPVLKDQTPHHEVIQVSFREDILDMYKHLL